MCWLPSEVAQRVSRPLWTFPTFQTLSHLGNLVGGGVSSEVSAVSNMLARLNCVLGGQGQASAGSTLFWGVLRTIKGQHAVPQILPIAPCKAPSLGHQQFQFQKSWHLELSLG